MQTLLDRPYCGTGRTAKQVHTNVLKHLPFARRIMGSASSSVDSTFEGHVFQLYVYTCTHVNSATSQFDLPYCEFGNTQVALIDTT